MIVHRLLPLCWVLLSASPALAYFSGLDPGPQIISPLMLANNPTLTTVALQKPVCVFEDDIRGDAGVAAPDFSLYSVALYGLQASAPETNLTFAGSFQSTGGGLKAPFLVARFAVPNCTLLGAAAPAPLQDYIVRVGDNTSCLEDPNFSGVCNPPLGPNTAYRFVYGLLKNVTILGQTLWSDKIATKAVKGSDTLDTWPGRRSGGMIVITSILSVLLFLLLSGFVAAVAANVLSGGSPGGQTTRHETTTQQAVPKAHPIPDPAYASALQGGPTERERYTAKPQV